MIGSFSRVLFLMNSFCRLDLMNCDYLWIESDDCFLWWLLCFYPALLIWPDCWWWNIPCVCCCALSWFYLNPVTRTLMTFESWLMIDARDLLVWIDWYFLFDLLAVFIWHWLPWGLFSSCLLVADLVRLLLIAGLIELLSLMFCSRFRWLCFDGCWSCSLMRILDDCGSELLDCMVMIEWFVILDVALFVFWWTECDDFWKDLVFVWCVTFGSVWTDDWYEWFEWSLWCWLDLKLTWILFLCSDCWLDSEFSLTWSSLWLTVSLPLRSFILLLVLLSELWWSVPWWLDIAFNCGLWFISWDNSWLMWFWLVAALLWFFPLFLLWDWWCAICVFDPPLADDLMNGPLIWCDDLCLICWHPFWPLMMLSLLFIGLNVLILLRLLFWWILIGTIMKITLLLLLMILDCLTSLDLMIWFVNFCAVNVWLIVISCAFYSDHPCLREFWLSDCFCSWSWHNVLMCPFWFFLWPFCLTWASWLMIGLISGDFILVCRNCDLTLI